MSILDDLLAAGVEPAAGEVTTDDPVKLSWSPEGVIALKGAGLPPSGIQLDARGAGRAGLRVGDQHDLALQLSRSQRDGAPPNFLMRMLGRKARPEVLLQVELRVARARISVAAPCPDPALLDNDDVPALEAQAVETTWSSLLGLLAAARAHDAKQAWRGAASAPESTPPVAPPMASPARVVEDEDDEDAFLDELDIESMDAVFVDDDDDEDDEPVRSRRRRGGGDSGVGMEVVWYAERIDGEHIGPLPETLLEDAFYAGELTLNSPVWREGEQARPLLMRHPHLDGQTDHIRDPDFFAELEPFLDVPDWSNWGEIIERTEDVSSRSLRQTLLPRIGPRLATWPDKERKLTYSLALNTLSDSEVQPRLELVRYFDVDGLYADSSSALEQFCNMPAFRNRITTLSVAGDDEWSLETEGLEEIAALSWLTAVQHFLAAETGLDRKALKVLARLPFFGHLVSLDLSKNPLESMRRLSQHLSPTLERLFLESCELTDVSLTALCEHAPPRLRVLDISGNAFTSSTAQEQLQGLPFDLDILVLEPEHLPPTPLFPDLMPAFWAHLGEERYGGPWCVLELQERVRTGELSADTLLWSVDDPHGTSTALRDLVPEISAPPMVLPAAAMRVIEAFTAPLGEDSAWLLDPDIPEALFSPRTEPDGIAELDTRWERLLDMASTLSREQLYRGLLPRLDAMLRRCAVGLQRGYSRLSQEQLTTGLLMVRALIVSMESEHFDRFTRVHFRNRVEYLDLGAQEDARMTPDRFDVLARLRHFSRLRSINLGGAEITARSARALHSMTCYATLRELDLTRCEVLDIGALFGEGCPWKLHALVLDGNAVDDATFAWLLNTPALAELQRLSVCGVEGLTASGLAALTQAPCAPHLTLLDVAFESEGQDVTALLEGLAFAASSPRLRLLSVVGASVSRAHAFTAPVWTHLRSLTLSKCELSDAVACEILRGVSGAPLIAMSLSENGQLSDYTAEAISQGGFCATLRSLELEKNAMSANGLRLILQSALALRNLDLSHNAISGDPWQGHPLERWPRTLRRLVLSHNTFDHALLSVLLSTPFGLEDLELESSGISGEFAAGFPGATCFRSDTEDGALNLAHNPLGDMGALYLSRSPCVERVDRLELAHCGVGDDGLRALGQSPFVSNLYRLSLDGNPVNIEGLQALARSEHLKSWALTDNTIVTEISERLASELDANPSERLYIKLESHYAAFKMYSELQGLQERYPDWHDFDRYYKAMYGDDDDDDDDDDDW